MTAATVQPTPAPVKAPTTPLGPCPHCGGSRLRCCEFGADKPPERSLQQRLDALERANKIRTYRKDLKKDVKRGERLVPDILLEPDDELATMKIEKLLIAMPKIGRIKANRMLTRMRISPSKTVGGLSERQRCELVSMLGPARL
jgi:hypothetical protein